MTTSMSAHPKEKKSEADMELIRSLTSRTHFLFLFYLQPFLSHFIGEISPINAGRKVEDRKEKTCKGIQRFQNREFSLRL